MSIEERLNQIREKLNSKANEVGVQCAVKFLFLSIIVTVKPFYL